MAEALQDNPRSSWAKDSQVEVYGSKSKKWFKGKIVGIDEDDDGEWLKVIYKTDKKEIMMRKVQRYSDQVQPIGGDNAYKAINIPNDDEKENKNNDNNNENNNNNDDIKNNDGSVKKKKVKHKLNKAKPEIIYPADKYLDEAEREVIESHEKGDAKTTITLLKTLKCQLWDISNFDKNNPNEVAYVCDDGYMLHAEVIRINGDKTKIFVHLGNDYRHYEFYLKQKSVWLEVPNERIFNIDALQKYPNPKAKVKKVDPNDEDIPANALEFFKQTSGMSAGQLGRHESVETIVGDIVKPKANNNDETL